MNEVLIKEILSYLKEQGIKFAFDGSENEKIIGFSSLKNYKPGSITWIKTINSIPEGLDETTVSLVVTSPKIKGDYQNVIRTEESKRAFFSVIEHFFDSAYDYPPIGQFTYIGPKVKIGKNVRIGHNCSLDGDITIGDNCVIWNNVTILHKVAIGNNTEIQSGTVIGHDGFGYTEDKNHIKTMIKHYGGVKIGSNVLISSNVCVVRGTIDDTIIEDGCKIDNLSHIAHNCCLGKNVALAFPCFLGGSVTIETNGYIAGGIVRNQCSVRENAFVGMGAVVTKDVAENTTVVGNPAKLFKK